MVCFYLVGEVDPEMYAQERKSGGGFQILHYGLFLFGGRGRLIVKCMPKKEKVAGFPTVCKITHKFIYWRIDIFYFIFLETKNLAENCIPVYLSFGSPLSPTLIPQIRCISFKFDFSPFAFKFYSSSDGRFYCRNPLFILQTNFFPEHLIELWMSGAKVGKFDFLCLKERRVGVGRSWKFSRFWNEIWIEKESRIDFQENWVSIGGGGEVAISATSALFFQFSERIWVLTQSFNSLQPYTWKGEYSAATSQEFSLGLQRFHILSRLSQDNKIFVKHPKFVVNNASYTLCVIRTNLKFVHYSPKCRLYIVCDAHESDIRVPFAQMPAIHCAWFARIWNSCTIRANKLQIVNLHELLSIHYSWICQIHDSRTHLRIITNNNKPISWYLISRLESRNFQNKLKSL